MKPTVFLLALLLAAGALSACMELNLQKPPVEKRYYVIEPDNIPAPGEVSGAEERVLSVRNIRVSDTFDGANLVYRTGEFEWRSDYYNHFFIPPHSMLTGAVREALADSGLFSQVLSDGSILGPTHFLEGSVTSMYGDFSRKESPAAVLEMEFLLLDDRGGSPSVLLEKAYRSRLPLQETTPEALVDGLGRGFTQIMQELQQDIVNALKGQS
ncbi:MAG: ABC-type transport auxiliary lipoprotein family protein [Candidatus Sumerlaeota bacterium]